MAVAGAAATTSGGAATAPTWRPTATAAAAIVGIVALVAAGRTTARLSDAVDHGLGHLAPALPLSVLLVGILASLLAAARGAAPSSIASTSKRPLDPRAGETGSHSRGRERDERGRGHRGRQAPEVRRRCQGGTT